MKSVEALTTAEQCLHLKLSNELRSSKANIRALEFGMSLGFAEDYSSLIRWYKNDIIRLENEINKLIAD